MVINLNENSSCDFDLVSVSLQPQTNHQSNQFINIGPNRIHHQQDNNKSRDHVHQNQQELVAASSSSSLVTPSTLTVGQTLTWNFFDQISRLDKELRCEESEGNCCDKSTIDTEKAPMSKSQLQQSPVGGDSDQLSSPLDNVMNISPLSSPTITINSSPPLTTNNKNFFYVNHHHSQPNATITTNSLNRRYPTYNSNNLNSNINNNNNNNNNLTNPKRSSSYLPQDRSPLPSLRNETIRNDLIVVDSGQVNNLRILVNQQQQQQQLHHHQQQQNQEQQLAACRSKFRQRTMGAGDGGHRIGTGFSDSTAIDYNLSLNGWRKKCLFTLILVLMLLIIVNLILTLWILKVMEFSSEGMGQLKIIPGGIQLTGQALIMDILRASTIRSRHGQPISIESSRNFSINTRDPNGILENQLFLGHDKLECLASEFRINDTTGRNLFSVNRNEVTIGAHSLRIDGEGGAIFRESIQTPHVRADAGRELRLESPTRQLDMSAAKDMNLQSRAGGLDMTALNDIKLSALRGSIRLESSKIVIPNLQTAKPPLPGAQTSRDHTHRVFQLCACASGKLFLASPHSICAGDDTTVCS